MPGGSVGSLERVGLEVLEEYKGRVKELEEDVREKEEEIQR